MTKTSLPESAGNYIALRREQLGRWRIFFKERFEPISHFIMIALFVYAHYLVVATSGEIAIAKHLIVYVGMGSALFFIKLRLYDEIKDYEVDLDKNPQRPLPRGLLTHFDLKRAIELCILFEIIFFASSGINAFLSIALAIAYSLLMYKEFFIAQLIRPHLTTYATSHTIVTFFLSIAIFSALTRQSLFSLNTDYLYFSLMSWLLFNIFELGRKTYQPCEEREGVPTYSKIWGKFGAILLVSVQALAASYLVLQISTIHHGMMTKLLMLQLIPLALVSGVYLFTKSKSTGKLFRLYSSIYILLVYLSLIINYLYRENL